jgi:hypothetical protein
MEQAELPTREVVEVVQEGIPQHLLQEQAALAVQVSLSSRFLTPGLQPFQAVLHPRYQLQYQDLRFTP